MSITLEDVATDAGVSIATASRVLNGKASALVSEATTERVRVSAERLGYRPSAAARALATGRTRTIALCCTQWQDHGQAELVKATHDIVNAAGYTLLLVPHGVTESVSELLRAGRVDAAIWTRYPVDEADELLEARSAPHQVVVAIGEVAEEMPRMVPSAVWDDRQGVLQALEHLAGQGHRHVAYLAGNPPDANVTGKGVGFTEGCAKLRLEGEVVLTPDAGDRLAAGARMARDVLRMRPLPTAIVARNDDVALGALHAIQEAGLRVPDDLSLVGYNDIAAAAYLSPSLTSVRVPQVRCVQAILPVALALIDRDPEEWGPPLALRFETELITRRSVGPPREAGYPDRGLAGGTPA